MILISERANRNKHVNTDSKYPRYKRRINGDATRSFREFLARQDGPLLRSRYTIFAFGRVRASASSCQRAETRDGGKGLLLVRDSGPYKVKV